MSFKIINGDCIEELKKLDDCSIDSLCTDPPSGIGFMGKDWDSDKGGRDNWINWLKTVLEECFRVLKPGAHGFVWSLPRTSHWTGMACELAGFEPREIVHHCFGSGFPKNHNVPNAIYKALDKEERDLIDITQGIGTALKPSHEMWWLIRKPFKGSIANNVLEHGTGALNIDGCRVVYEEGDNLKGKVIQVRNNGDIYGGNSFNESATKGFEGGIPANDKGRWPPNMVMTHSYYCDDGFCVEDCPVYQLDQQSGHLKSGAAAAPDHSKSAWFGGGSFGPHNQIGDSGGASRFFPKFRYQAKPCRQEKEAGLDHMPLRRSNKMNEGGMQARRDAKADKAIESQALDGKGRTLIREDGSKTLVERFIPQYRANTHPTCKPIDLMRWLCRLITPPGGKILDPFMGSGTTGCGALLEGFEFIGIEMNPDYCEIARRRMNYWSSASTRVMDKNEEIDEEGKPRQMGLF